jgi:hypothetical protein
MEQQQPAAFYAPPEPHPIDVFLQQWALEQPHNAPVPQQHPAANDAPMPQQPHHEHVEQQHPAAFPQHVPLQQPHYAPMLQQHPAAGYAHLALQQPHFPQPVEQQQPVAEVSDNLMLLADWADAAAAGDNVVMTDLEMLALAASFVAG